MMWAMKQAPIEKTKTAVRNRMVLTYLADRYNDDTRACWPSLDRIARELDTSKTTIQRSVKELEEQGLIRRTSPQIVAHIPEYRRPTVWTLNLHMKREEMGSNVDTGGSNVDHPRVPTLEREGSNVDHLTQREPKEEPLLNLSSSFDEPGPDGFKEFWENYPRKIGKGKAEEHYREQLENAPTDTLLNAVKNFAAECRIQQTEKRYIPYPGTWLNQGRWRDYNLAPLDKSETSVDEIKSWEIDWDEEGDNAAGF